MVQAYGAIYGLNQRRLDLTRYVEAGDSILITTTCNTTTTNHTFSQAWAEV